MSMTRESIENFNAAMAMNGCEDTYIENSTFRGYTNCVLSIGTITLPTLKIPNGVEIVSSNNAVVRRENECMTELYVPDSVKQIGTVAFYNYKKLRQVIGCDGVEKVGKRAFYGCLELEQIEMKVCSEIMEYAFFRCIRLKRADFPSIVKIGSSAFDTCRALSGVTAGTQILLTNLKSH